MVHGRQYFITEFIKKKISDSLFSVFYIFMSVLHQLKNIFRNKEEEDEIVPTSCTIKSSLPKYEGLEDYTLIKKLGE